MNEKTVNINNFIAVYDNYITKEECDKAITLFENQDKFNNTVNRLKNEKASVLQKQDQQFFASGKNLDVWWENLKPMMINYNLAWDHYVQNVGAQDAYGDSFHFTCLKIQKSYLARCFSIFTQRKPAFIRSKIYLNFLDVIKRNMM